MANTLINITEKSPLILVKKEREKKRKSVTESEFKSMPTELFQQMGHELQKKKKKNLLVVNLASITELETRRCSSHRRTAQRQNYAA